MAQSFYVPANPETDAPAPKKAEKFRHWGNPDLAKAMHGKAASGASGTHQDRRTRGLRTRANQRRSAIRDYS